VGGRLLEILITRAMFSHVSLQIYLCNNSRVFEMWERTLNRNCFWRLDSSDRHLISTAVADMTETAAANCASGS